MRNFFPSVTIILVAPTYRDGILVYGYEQAQRREGRGREGGGRKKERKKQRNRKKRNRKRNEKKN